VENLYPKGTFRTKILTKKWRSTSSVLNPIKTSGATLRERRRFKRLFWVNFQYDLLCLSSLLFIRLLFYVKAMDRLWPKLKLRLGQNLSKKLPSEIKINLTRESNCFFEILCSFSSKTTSITLRSNAGCKFNFSIWKALEIPKTKLNKVDSSMFLSLDSNVIFMLILTIYYVFLTGAKNGKIPI